MKLLVLILFVVIGSFSCSENVGNSPKSNLKITMVTTPGGFSDMSFNYNCKKGLDSAARKYGFSCRYFEAGDMNNIEQSVEYCDAQGSDLIIGTGYYLSNPILSSAVKHFTKNYAIVDADYGQLHANIRCITFKIDEAAFPLGYLAAFWAEAKAAANPKVGCVGGANIEQVNQFLIPFIEGIKFYNNKFGKKVKFDSVYAGDFANPGKGDSIARKLISRGAIVIFAPAGGTGIGALRAAKSCGVWAIGHDVDCFYSLPEANSALISSCMKRLDNAVYCVAEQFIKAPTKNRGSSYKGSLSNQGVGLAPFHDYQDQIPDSIKAQLTEIQSGIITGTIKTGWK